jgi:hypothetical protein
VYVGVARTGHGPGVLLVGDDEEDIGTIWHEISFLKVSRSSMVKII